MTIHYPHAVLTYQYYILGPRYDDVSKVKVNYFSGTFRPGMVDLRDPPPMFRTSSRYKWKHYFDGIPMQM